MNKALTYRNKFNGDLHFLLNGADKGRAFENVPDGIYGFVDVINYVSKFHGKQIGSLEMARVEKLAIKGIRSFGLDKEQTINFRPPLTLIQGKNGSGKTTIIECLLYATCGKYPLSHFVHDLQIECKNQAEGEISIWFRDVENKSVTAKCVRELKKGNKNSLSSSGKTNYIKENDTGKSQPYLQVKFSQEMARRLGTSKAILSDIIFCDQENSNWPFLPAKDLKNKFDAIFGLIKYKKLNENIQSLYKEKRKEIGRKESILEALREKKDKKKQKTQELSEKERDLKEKHEEITCLEKSIKELEAEHLKIRKTEEDINRMKKERVDKDHQKALLNSKITSIEKNIYQESADLRKAKELFLKHENKELNPLEHESSDVYLSNLDEILKTNLRLLNEEKKVCDEEQTMLKSAEQDKDRLKKKLDEIDEKVRNIDVNEQLQSWEKYKLAKILEKDKLQEKHGEIWKKFCKEVSKENYFSEVECYWSDLVKEMKNKEKSLLEKQKSLDFLEYKESSLKEDLGRKMTDLKENDQKLKEKYKDANLNSVSNDLKQKIAQLQEEENRLSAFKCLFEHYITDLKKKDCCPLCDTKLNPVSRDEVVEKLKNKMCSPAKKDEMDEDEGELGKLKKELEQLQNVVIPLRNNNIKMEMEILSINEDISSTMEKISACQKECDDEKKELKTVIDEKESLDQIMVDKNLLYSINGDIKELETKITNQQRPNVTNCTLTEAVEEQRNAKIEYEKAIEIYKKKNSNVLESFMKLKEKREKYRYIKQDLQVKKNEQKKLKEKIKERDQKIEEIEKLIGNIKNIESDDHKKRIKEIEIEKQKKFGKKSFLEGCSSQIKKSICSLKEYLSKLSDADEKYYDEYLNLKVMEALCKDYETLAGALDAAITKVHQDRVRSINDVMRDLWTRVYKNDDIEAIEIESEETKEKNKAKEYNYSIVMIQNGVRKYMRDRCSAGQKGLACVIIRLAIAEVCTDFGMLVLDEPTTNLDEENSDSLGKALGKMVESRDKEKFQLVVITHDQNFVDQLSSQMNLQESYVVEQDSLNHSVIRRLNA